MGIISTLKSSLGVDGGRGTDRDRGTTVTVEREAGAGRDAGPTTAGDGDTATRGHEEPAAAAERAVKGTEDDSLAGEPAAERPGPSGTGEPVDAIKGIGAAYAERLGEAGVETVDDLAAADASALAEATGLGVGRVEGWIERAKVRVE